MQEVVKTMSSLQKDFIASFLRSQVVALQRVLETIENSERSENVYAMESIKRVDKELHRFRKLCVAN